MVTTELKILIVFPCYNEEFRLPVEEFNNFILKNQTIDFLFVNDGSKDKTIDILNELSLNNTNASVLNLTKNVGKAEAVRAAMLSKESQKYNYIGYFDADLAAPLSEIHNLISNGNINANPFLIMGSRIKLLGFSSIKRDLKRHYLGRIFATIVSNMLKLSVYDTQCGAKLIRTDISQKIFKEPFISKWLFDVELLFRVKKTEKLKENSIVEVPLKQWEEKGGSKIKKSYLLKVPIELIRIYLKYR